MKAHVLIVLTGVAGLFGLGCWENVTGVKGSGNAKTEVRTVARFSAIEVSGSMNAEITIAAEPRVEVSGDDNLVPLVDTQVDGNVLTIRNQNMRPKLPLTVHVAVPALTAVTSSGASTVTLHGMRGDRLSLGAHGAGTMHGDGAVHELTIVAAGAGTVDLDALTAERASVTASGSGTVAVNVTQALDVHVSGAGTVKYRGNPPDVKQDVSGAGTLVKR